MNEILPEGTDHIIPGAQNSARPADEDVASFRARAAGKASEVKDQVSDKAMAFAETGKARASSALDEVARMIGDTAGRIDTQLGAGYGDYARRAADAVSGAAGTLREKNVDELMDDARDVVRKSPAVAIGVAAAAGFALARILKAGSEALEGVAKDVSASSEAEPEPGPDPAPETPGKKRGKSKSSNDA